jgi:4-amino-4-deoxy-L-arabinose transferase-like glycosyltransferase
MGNDEGIWSYMARVWVDHAHQPYVDTIDDKPSGIILLNALSYQIFGLNYFFLRFMAGLVIFGTSFILYKLNKQFFGSGAGIFALLIYPFTMMWQIINGPVIAQTETFMVFFSTLAFWLWFVGPIKHKPANYLLIGICFGFAVSFKQVAGLSLIALLLIIVNHYQWSRSIIKSIALTGTAFVFIFCLLQLPVVADYETLKNYIHFVWLNPNHYSTLIWRIPKFLETFWQSRLTLFYPFLIGAFWILKQKSNATYIRGLWIWLFLTFIGANLSGYYYGHQLTPMLPAMSLLTGAFIAYTIHQAQISFVISLIGLILLFLPYPVMASNGLSTLSGSKSFAQSIEGLINGKAQPKIIGKMVKKNTDSEDYVYYFGHRTNAILSYSDRRSATPYFHTIFIVDKNTQKKVVKDLKTNDPKFIIKDRKTRGFHLIDNYVQSHYKLYRKFNYWYLYQRN